MVRRLRRWDGGADPERVHREARRLLNRNVQRTTDTGQAAAGRRLTT